MKLLLLAVLLVLPVPLAAQMEGMQGVIFAVPMEPPESWRAIYHEVEDCAGRTGNYDVIKWSSMPAPYRGPKGETFAVTDGNQIILVRGDTTYLRHEMLHHILLTSGWLPPPRPLKAGETYDVADTHPSPPFFVCTGGR